MTEAAQECQAQLAQVHARIADAMKSRSAAEQRGYSRRTIGTISDRLRRLHALAADIQRDMAEVA